MEDDIIMSDTLDNFTFPDEKLSISGGDKNVSQEISFNDSFFLEDVSIDFKEANDQAHTGDNNGVGDTSFLTRSSCTSSPLCHNTNNNLTVEHEPLTVLSNVKNLEKLSSWGLPDIVLDKYKARKIETMFPWQYECLSNPKVLNNLSNLIYSAPTSAGKTLVAEILALKTLFERKKKVIFILPFVSIVREKMYYFQDILGSSGIRAEGFMGSYNPPGGFNATHFAICTIEKANSLLNRLLEEGRLNEIGSVLIDEMHLLGDPHRGYLLELLLTKLRYICSKDKSIEVQIIGMSATLPNLDELASWLDAELYSTSFRPIPLYEQISLNGEIYDSNFKLLRKLQPLPNIGVDTDNILQLCLETIQESCSVLIFCPTKNWCENLAQQLAVAFYQIGNSDSQLGQTLRHQIKSDLILEVMEQLKFCPVGLDSILKKTVSFGIAFHHAGLTMEERDIVEGGFRNGVLKVLVATSTLSSGVNLPARRVLIRSPNFCGKPLDLLAYRQMIGRAGRMGRDTQGESILICQKNDYNIGKHLVSGELPAVESCLEGAGKLKRAILEIIASGVAETPEDVDLFTSCTLLAVTKSNKENNSENPIEETIEFLKSHEFIRLQQKDDYNRKKYIATALGKACLSSSIAPDEGLALFTELEKARQCFVLETELHLIYLVTPYSACYSWGNIDWMFYLDMWDKLSKAMKRVGELVGISVAYLISATRGKIDTSTSSGYHKMLVHKRFFVALALQDLVNEMPLDEVCNKFGCNRGMLQSLQQSASTFAGMVTSFSKQLGWSSVEILLTQFQDRMHFGVSRDLLDLMRLPSLNGKLARTLFNSGVKSVVNLANSRVNDLENIIVKAGPFESTKRREGESEGDAKQRNNLKLIWVAGKSGFTEREAAELLIKEARDYLVIEMGLKEAHWASQETNDTEEKNISLRIENNFEPSIELNSTSKVMGLTPRESSPRVENNLESRIELNSISKVMSLTPRVENNLEPSIELNGTSKSDEYVSKVMSLTPKESSPEILMSSSPLKENNSNLSIFSKSESDSFSLHLTEESLDNKSHDNCNTQGVFDAAMQNLDVSQEIRNFQSKKRIRPTSETSSEESFLEATPKKSKALRINKIITPLRSTIKRYSQMSLKDENNSQTPKGLFSSLESKRDFTKLSIVDISDKDSLLKTFIDELSSKTSFSFSLACSRSIKNNPVIGANILGTVIASEPTKFHHGDRRLDGLAFCWGGIESYYLPINEFSTFFNEISQIFSNREHCIVMMDAKEQIKTLKQCCGVEFHCKIEDPKIIDWLIDVNSEEKGLHSLINTYCRELIELNKLCAITNACGSIGLDVNSIAEARLRASIEAVTIWHLLKIMKEKLFNDMPKLNTSIMSNFQTAYDLEMQTSLTLANVELCGMCIDKTGLQNLADSLKQEQMTLERKAFSLAGRKFNFISPVDVAKVTGLTKGSKALKQHDHPLSKTIILWRKLNHTITKVIYPLLRLCRDNRIHGRYDSYTATGRITMHEPNIQMVTKDFDVGNNLFSCRKVFTVPEDYVLVSADFCQLELRILTYLSKDEFLMNIMGQPGDIFKFIAAKWNNIAEKMVDDDMRQRTKQICYGIIYGIGTKALAEQLAIPEEDALSFMESFRNTYSGIKLYIKQTVQECRERGYVETIVGRRRQLPNITHSDSSLRSQAERQAVNTTIQGSAADIVKNAMINIEQKFNLIFKQSRFKPQLTLHLHDELIYEVPEKYLEKTVKIIRRGMESSGAVLGCFPVKVKVGKSWGELREYAG